jgi:hypothetical protein
LLEEIHHFRVAVPKQFVLGFEYSKGIDEEARVLVKDRIKPFLISIVSNIVMF